MIYKALVIQKRRVQAARDIQLKCFSKNGSSDMRIGEIRQFCKWLDEGAVHEPA
jgi:hypothetical protein